MSPSRHDHVTRAFVCRGEQPLGQLSFATTLSYNAASPMPRRKHPRLSHSQRVSVDGDEEEGQGTAASRETSGTEDTQPRKRVRWGGDIETQDDEEDPEEQESSSSAEREKVRFYLSASHPFVLTSVPAVHGSFMSIVGASLGYMRIQPLNVTLAAAWPAHITIPSRSRCMCSRILRRTNTST